MFVWVFVSAAGTLKRRRASSHPLTFHPPVILKETNITFDRKVRGLPAAHPRSPAASLQPQLLPPRFHRCCRPEARPVGPSTPSRERSSCGGTALIAPPWAYSSYRTVGWRSTASPGRDRSSSRRLCRRVEPSSSLNPPESRAGRAGRRRSPGPARRFLFVSSS